ncbi:neck protein [Synechococcus phage S-CAM3]|uniref:Neck protein n=1 Tax=Synechococcus phage S-CAM3 TaxID=1883366 RepID=A0A1D8KJ05_9CAUD|nr:head closure Hc2 [Synechococcus phage S-CAM3]AOV58619.1 neck protein [Synechococcus phage S-CAM3]AOV58858.1 neck protein [Synechococcus phage S-CAM3]AOV59097.1 neck protein [Synechococcus phage S-CAM3]
MKSIYFPQHGGVSTEQGLIQSLVDEQIKLFGSDVYYLPRKMIKDVPLNDVLYSEFTTQYMIEMLLINVEGFGSPSEFISKFGLRITDEITMVVSQNRWSQVFQEFADITTVDGRPNEGDLIYLPLTQDLYEIKFVEREAPFYQLGKNYIYTMTAEIYELGNDEFETGIGEIDEIEEIFAPSITLDMDTAATTHYIQGETVTGGTTGTTAEVSFWDRDNHKLTLINRNGNFTPGETITGSESGVVQDSVEVDNLTLENVEYADNKYIETTADDLLDFTERNPFGEYGKVNGEF